MIVSWSSSETEQNMPESILVESAEMVRSHPWWRARAALAIRLLRRMGVHAGASVLDAGCGWGVALEALERNGYHVTGLDASRVALQSLDGPGRVLVQADLARPLPAVGDAFDAVLALDVIEHIDEDRVAVTNLARLTRPGGVAILSVPALPFLYSEFDEVQGHRRRYRPVTLRQAVAGSGLRLERILWWGAVMVVPFSLRWRRSRGRAGSAGEIYRRYLALPPEPLLGMLRLILALENALTMTGVSPVGTSLFALARRWS